MLALRLDLASVYLDNRFVECQSDAETAEVLTTAFVPGTAGKNDLKNAFIVSFPVVKDMDGY